MARRVNLVVRGKESMMLMQPSRFFIFFIVLSALAFSVRLASVVTGFSALLHPAYAQSEDVSSAKDEVMESSLIVDDTKDGGKDTMDVMEKDLPDVDAPLWQDAGDTDVFNTAMQMEMIEEIAERRKTLSERENALITREAVLKASEQEMERKFQELSQLKGEIEGLLKQQSDEELSRIQSLVKVYEAMKAKDAARIFDTLDLDVLVAVMSNMSERRLSPILASMNPERARTVTIVLAEQKKLPSLPGEGL